MQISILKPGLLSTIQDMGRNGYYSQGVPHAGAMDTLSARIANLAIGNHATDAVIEFTYGNASFKCETDILIAFAGSGAKWMVNEIELPAAKAIFLPKETIVTLNNQTSGVRSYLAIAGGWNLPKILGSFSTYLPAEFGGFNGRALKKNDALIHCKQLSETNISLFNLLKGCAVKYMNWGIYHDSFLPQIKNKIRVVPGREFNWFTAQSIITFLSEPFTIDIRGNRMGIKLNGNLLKKKKNTELLSTGVCFGTIQVSGNGEAILLMADCQTTGGYPRIAQVAAVDLPLCAQLKPGDFIRFEEISQFEAEQLYYEQEADLERLALTIQTKLQ